MRMLVRSLLCLLLIPLLTCLFPMLSQAQVVLKPNGQNAIPLRVKAIAANVVLDGQFAATRLALTFQNQTAVRIEADFLYTLPPDTLVTSFAYWYGEERVQAKVVEKEEAAAIYQHITERMHDPALIEMVGKNTFRARIFPVMPNSDLKVEMTLVQALVSDPKGAHFVLPLRMAYGETLDHVNVQVHINPNGYIEKVTNSYGLPVAKSGRAYGLTLNAAQFHPQQDLRVNLIRRVQPLYADLFATRSADEWGYFALALTPDHTLVHPQLRIVGVEVKQLVPAHLTMLRAHQAFILEGRYRGGGPATVVLTGKSTSGSLTLVERVRFSTLPQPDSVVTKLWAARWMEKLSDDGAKRDEVMRMSLRYKMPSRYTSWLAVPHEEIERYEREITEAKVQALTQRLEALILAKRDGTSTGRRLRAQLDILCRKLGESTDDVLRECYRSSIDPLAQRIVAMDLEGREHTLAGRRLRAEFYELCRRAGWSSADAMSNARAEQLSSLGDELSNLILNRKAHSARADKLRLKLHRYVRNGHLSQKEFQRYYPSEQVNDQLESLADNVQEAERGSSIWWDSNRPRPNLPLKQPDPERARRLRAELNALAAKVGVSADAYLREIDAMWAEYKIHGLELRLKAERQRPNASADAIRQLQGDLDRLNAEWKSKKYSEALEAQYARYSLHHRSGDPLISVEAPGDSLHVVALMPTGEVKPLAFNANSNRWEARFDIPTYATEGDYVITVLIVLKNGVHTRLQIHYQVDLTPPGGAGTAQIVSSFQPVLRLQLDAGEEVARVKALLPWGAMVELLPTGQANRFFALVPLSPEHRNRTGVVKYILTDRAHNRTTIQVDMSAQ